MTDKLKSCPFCGVQLENEPPSSIYAHPNNGCLLSLIGITKEQFAEWNTRKPMDSIVEQLEAEKYRGMECLEPVLISFNFGINKAIEIVKGGGESGK